MHNSKLEAKQRFAIILTGNLEIGPFLRRPTEIVDVLQEVAAARHDELITAFLRVATGVEFDRQVDGPGNVHLVLGREGEKTEMIES